jgi:hypothetical protein
MAVKVRCMAKKALGSATPVHVIWVLTNVIKTKHVYKTTLYPGEVITNLLFNI